MGRQSGASRRWRLCTSVWAASWVRAPGTLWVMQHHHDLAERVKGDPQPHCACPAPQPRPQFVELNVGEVEIVKDAVVEGGAVCPSSCQPGRDRGVAVTEHAHGSGHIEPFGQRRQHFTNPVGVVLRR
jgi:hypothetical protein